MGVNLDTLRPEPCVEGYSTPGGYSYRAVKPIALERVMAISTMLGARGFREQGVSLSGIGGVETGGDAAEFILLGADTVQVGGGGGNTRGLGGKGGCACVSGEEVAQWWSFWFPACCKDAGFVRCVVVAAQ
jgi:hypothetical protein